MNWHIRTSFSIHKIDDLLLEINGTEVEENPLVLWHVVIQLTKVEIRVHKKGFL